MPINHCKILRPLTAKSPATPKNPVQDCAILEEIVTKDCNLAETAVICCM